jgi:hypothetical protein
LIPESLEKGIQKAKNLNLHPCGIIPVDMLWSSYLTMMLSILLQRNIIFGSSQMQLKALAALTKVEKLAPLAESTTTSFYPAKPLGCYGDGGSRIYK